MTGDDSSLHSDTLIFKNQGLHGGYGSCFTVYFHEVYINNLLTYSYTCDLSFKVDVHDIGRLKIFRV